MCIMSSEFSVYCVVLISHIQALSSQICIFKDFKGFGPYKTRLSLNLLKPYPKNYFQEKQINIFRNN